VVFDIVASAIKEKKMEALIIAGVLTFARTSMAFLSAYAEVQSDYLMTVRAKSERNKYGKID
jgi:hypothetical protein